MTLVFERAKTVHALNRAATVIGTYSTCLRQFVKMRPATIGSLERPMKGIYGMGSGFRVAKPAALAKKQERHNPT
jgi:hypothetical protein